METAKLFANGGSQAVRLPKDCRFDGDEVLIQKVGNLVILMPKSDPWCNMLEGYNLFTEDFLKEVPEDLPLQERDVLS